MTIDSTAAFIAAPTCRNTINSKPWLLGGDPGAAPLMPPCEPAPCNAKVDKIGSSVDGCFDTIFARQTSLRKNSTRAGNRPTVE